MFDRHTLFSEEQMEGKGGRRVVSGRDDVTGSQPYHWHYKTVN